jgi:uncharacterized membrane protein YidH (DUF202 family)
MTGGEAPPPAVFDPGLQLERTTLAWGRTALGLVANGALMLRFARETHPQAFAYVVGAVTMASGVAVWVQSRLDYPRRNAALLAGKGSLRPRALRLVHIAVLFATCGTGVAAITALVGD